MISQNRHNADIRHTTVTIVDIYRLERDCDNQRQSQSTGRVVCLRLDRHLGRPDSRLHAARGVRRASRRTVEVRLLSRLSVRVRVRWFRNIRDSNHRSRLYCSLRETAHRTRSDRSEIGRTKTIESRLSDHNI